MSAANLELARSYRDEVLSEQRTGFYDRLRRITEQWLKRPRPAEQDPATALRAAAPAEGHARVGE